MNTKQFLRIFVLALVGVSCSKQQPTSTKGRDAPYQPLVEGAPNNPAKQTGLDEYVGRDLRKLDEAAAGEFRERVKSLTDDKPEKKEWGSFEAWWVRPFVAGEARWVFVEAYPGYNVPDVSAVQIHVFDKQWKRLTKQSFPTGYRFFLNDVSIARDNPLSVELVVAKTTSAGPFIVKGDEKHAAFEQGDFQLQYYALLHNQFVLVRLEDNDGRVAQNHYRWSSPPKGPEVQKRTVEQWIRSLGSENPIELLATLVWLSGAHLSSTDARHENVNQESIEDSRTFESVRDALDTKNAIQALASSKNEWVKEYAKLVGERQ